MKLKNVAIQKHNQDPVKVYGETINKFLKALDKAVNKVKIYK